VAVFKKAALSWSQQFYEAVCLEGNSAQNQYSSFDILFAVDGLTSIKTDSSNAFQELKEYQQHTRDWIFGYLSYDLKNNVEHLKSQNFDGLEFPEFYFFQPKKIIVIRGDQVEFNYLKMVDEEKDKE
jgi:para-aminobenzoate synthetase component 1